jgi:hypothetical protein
VTDLYLLDKSALARVTLQPTVQAALERLDDIGVLATTAVIDLEIGSAHATSPSSTRSPRIAPTFIRSFRSPARSQTAPERFNENWSGAGNTEDQACPIC